MQMRKNKMRRDRCNDKRDQMMYEENKVLRRSSLAPYGEFVLTGQSHAMNMSQSISTPSIECSILQFRHQVVSQFCRPLFCTHSLSHRFYSPSSSIHSRLHPHSSTMNSQFSIAVHYPKTSPLVLDATPGSNSPPAFK